MEQRKDVTDKIIQAVCRAGNRDGYFPHSREIQDRTLMGRETVGRHGYVSERHYQIGYLRVGSPG